MLQGDADLVDQYEQIKELHTRLLPSDATLTTSQSVNRYRRHVIKVNSELQGRASTVTSSLSYKEKMETLAAKHSLHDAVFSAAVALCNDVYPVLGKALQSVQLHNTECIGEMMDCVMQLEELKAEQSELEVEEEIQRQKRDHQSTSTSITASPLTLVKEVQYDGDEEKADCTIFAPPPPLAAHLKKLINVPLSPSTSNMAKRGNSETKGGDPVEESLLQYDATYDNDNKSVHSNAMHSPSSPSSSSIFSVADSKSFPLGSAAGDWGIQKQKEAKGAKEAKVDDISVRIGEQSHSVYSEQLHAKTKTLQSDPDKDTGEFTGSLNSMKRGSVTLSALQRDLYEVVHPARKQNCDDAEQEREDADVDDDIVANNITHKSSSKQFSHSLVPVNHDSDSSKGIISKNVAMNTVRCEAHGHELGRWRIGLRKAQEKQKLGKKLQRILTSKECKLLCCCVVVLLCCCVVWLSGCLHMMLYQYQ